MADTFMGMSIIHIVNSPSVAIDSIHNNGFRDFIVYCVNNVRIYKIKWNGSQEPLHIDM